MAFFVQHTGNRKASAFFIITFEMNITLNEDDTKYFCVTIIFCTFSI